MWCLRDFRSKRWKVVIIQSEWYHYQLFWHDFAIYNQQSYQKQNSPGATLCSLAKVLYSNEPKRYCWYSPDSLQTERDTESLQRIQYIICISDTCTYIELSVYILVIREVYVYRCDCLDIASLHTISLSFLYILKHCPSFIPH